MSDLPQDAAFNKEDHVVFRLASTLYLKAKNSIEKFKKSITDNEDSL